MMMLSAYIHVFSLKDIAIQFTCQPLRCMNSHLGDVYPFKLIYSHLIRWFGYGMAILIDGFRLKDI